MTKTTKTTTTTTPERVPVTGGAGRFPIVDRYGRRLHVGDRLRAQVCIGPYGQTAIVETTITEADEHWSYCQLPAPGTRGLLTTRYDPADQQLHCDNVHRDVEHGHATWAEILPPLAAPQRPAASDWWTPKRLARHGWQAYPVPADAHGGFVENLDAIVATIGSASYDAMQAGGRWYVRRVAQ